MKKTFLFVFAVLIFGSVNSQKITHSWAGEIIFGFSNAAYTTPIAGETIVNKNKVGSVSDAMRFTIWFHLGYYTHIDFNKTFGIYTGIANRNIGFITKERATGETTDLVKWKRRAYSLGVPLAIKFGKLDKGLYFFTGAQYEMLYHYKEKEFLPSGKRKYTEWFSKRVNMFLPSVFAGITFPDGLTVKATYSLSNMMNEDYSFNNESNVKVEPYKYFNSKLFYISIYSMLPMNKDVLKSVKEEKKLVAWM